MATKIPEWESELWSYISGGDGMHCPLYYHCQNRQVGGWCSADEGGHLNQLLYEERFDSSNFNFIKGGCGRICLLVGRLAKNTLKKNAIYCPPVSTELVSLLDTEHPVEIRLIPLKSYHGAIWRLRDQWVIQLRNDDTPATQRFTLFHEAFHILAHCGSNATPVFSKRGVTVGAFNEMLADYFAACVLMPGEWVKEKWAEVDDLNQMAKIFDVPKPAMFIRLKRLDLI